MKKIGILTFHNAYNFGAVLQAYALKEYLQKNSNCTVEIVNYKNEQIEKEKSRWESLFNNNVIKELARNLLTTPYYLKLDKVFSRFVNKYLTADNEIKKEDLSSLKYDLSGELHSLCPEGRRAFHWQSGRDSAAVAGILCICGKGPRCG